MIVLTGRSDEADRVRGFARGADDYVPKPFGYGELLGRDPRRAAPGVGAARLRGVIRVGELTHRSRPRAPCDSRASRSTSRAKEFALLQALAADPTRVYLKHDLLRDVWGYAVARHLAHRRRSRVPAAQEALRPRAARSW